MRYIRHCLLVGVLVSQAPMARSQLVKPAHPLWKPIVDKVYLQEVSSLINTDHPLKAVAVHEGAPTSATSAGCRASKGILCGKWPVRTDRCLDSGH